MTNKVKKLIGLIKRNSLTDHDQWTLRKYCVFMKPLFPFFIKAMPDAETTMFGTGVATYASDNTTAVA